MKKIIYLMSIFILLLVTCFSCTTLSFKDTHKADIEKSAEKIEIK